MDAAKKGQDDIALLLGASADREKLAVLRKRGDQVEAALMEKTKEGQPLTGEVVRLAPREEPHLYDVETLYEGPKKPRSAEAQGPAQVATRSYRKGWDRLFKKKASSGRPN